MLCYIRGRSYFVIVFMMTKFRREDMWRGLVLLNKRGWSVLSLRV